MTNNTKKIIATYKKSSISYKKDQKDTIKLLGFKKLGETRELVDNQSTRGMLLKVQHLVSIKK